MLDQLLLFCLEIPQISQTVYRLHYAARNKVNKEPLGAQLAQYDHLPIDSLCDHDQTRFSHFISVISTYCRSYYPYAYVGLC